MEKSEAAIESLMGERGRLRTVHEMLKAALEVRSRDASFVPLYLAIGRYMEASMGRLDSQDVRMLARLGEKLGDADRQDAEIIAEVHRRLDGNREHLKKYLAATAALNAARENSAAIKAYESTSAAYIDYIVHRMGHHAPSTDLARRLFAASDWIEIADINATYLARESALYDAVFDARPDSVPIGESATDYVKQYRLDSE